MVLRFPFLSQTTCPMKRTYQLLFVAVVSLGLGVQARTAWAAESSPKLLEEIVGTWKLCCVVLWLCVQGKTRSHQRWLRSEVYDA